MTGRGSPAQQLLIPASYSTIMYLTLMGVLETSGLK